MSDLSATDVSVVIVNKDDPGVEWTLDALEQISPEIEVVVVDASKGALSEIANRHPRARWVDFHSDSRGRTIAQQRNLGLRESSRDIVIYLDSGCIPSPTWIDHLLAPLAQGDVAAVAGGARSLHDNGEGHHVVAGDIHEFSTLNVAIRRSALEAVGGFNEHLGLAEDVDVAWRLSDDKWRLVAVDDADVLHDYGNLRTRIKRAFRYGRGRARLYRAHPRRRRDLWRRDRVPIYSAVMALALLVSPFLWPAAIIVVLPAVMAKEHRLRQVGWMLVYGFGELTEVASWVKTSK